MGPEIQTIGGLVSGGGIVALCIILYRLFDRHLGRVEEILKAGQETSASIDAKLAILIDRVDREPTPVHGIPTAYSIKARRQPSNPSEK